MALGPETIKDFEGLLGPVAKEIKGLAGEVKELRAKGPLVCKTGVAITDRVVELETERRIRESSQPGTAQPQNPDSVSVKAGWFRLNGQAKNIILLGNAAARWATVGLILWGFYEYMQWKIDKSEPKRPITAMVKNAN